MGSTAPPGRPKMRSTPSSFKLSSSIRAPDSFTSLPSMRASWDASGLEESRRRQALLDVFDAVAVGSAERRPARPAVEALQVQRRLEAADAEAARHAPIRQNHTRRDRVGFFPTPLLRERV